MYATLVQTSTNGKRHRPAAAGGGLLLAAALVLVDVLINARGAHRLARQAQVEHYECTSPSLPWPSRLTSCPRAASPARCTAAVAGGAPPPARSAPADGSSGGRHPVRQLRGVQANASEPTCTLPPAVQRLEPEVLHAPGGGSCGGPGHHEADEGV